MPMKAFKSFILHIHSISAVEIAKVQGKLVANSLMNVIWWENFAYSTLNNYRIYMSGIFHDGGTRKQFR